MLFLVCVIKDPLEKNILLNPGPIGFTYLTTGFITNIKPTAQKPLRSVRLGWKMETIDDKKFEKSLLKKMKKGIDRYVLKCVHPNVTNFFLPKKDLVMVRLTPKYFCNKHVTKTGPLLKIGREFRPKNRK